MKIKYLVLVSIAAIIIGVGGWVFFLSQTTPSRESQPTQKTDTIAPVVRLNISGSTLDLAKASKILEVSAEASDNHMVVQVEYLLDGKVVARSIEPPFKASINIAGLAPGEHTLQAVAYDAADNKSASAIFVFIIEKEGEVTPANEGSRGLVQRSSPTNRNAGRTSSVVARSSPNGPPGNSAEESDKDDTIEEPSTEATRTPGGWWASFTYYYTDM